MMTKSWVVELYERFVISFLLRMKLDWPSNCPWAHHPVLKNQTAIDCSSQRWSADLIESEIWVSPSNAKGNVYSCREVKEFRFNFLELAMHRFLEASSQKRQLDIPLWGRIITKQRSSKFLQYHNQESQCHCDEFRQGGSVNWLIDRSSSNWFRPHWEKSFRKLWKKVTLKVDKKIENFTLQQFSPISKTLSFSQNREVSIPRIFYR